MFGKPFDELQEHELKAVVAEHSVTIERFKATISAYGTAVKQRQRALSILRDRYGLDLVTGRRISKRTRRGELDLTG